MGVEMAEINGKYEEINDVNLLDYLIKNKYRVDRIVVDYNGDIVKKNCMFCWWWIKNGIKRRRFT